MSVAAVTMVRNEIDIIDTFVGYHHELLDHHLILDTGSTDGTRDRLVDLTGRFVGLEVRFQDLPAFEQASVVSSMAREVVRTQGVDFVVPLDCDEFLSRTEGPIARGWEADLPPSVVSAFRWATYVPDVEVTTDRPVIAQITKRREIEDGRNANVIVPAEVVRAPGFRLSQGSHSVSVGGHRLDAVVSDQFRLAHFPIRSANQSLKKYLVGWLSNLARRDSALFDWADFYNELKYSSNPDLAVLQRMAYGYDANEPQGLVHDPLDLSHCEVLAPPGRDRDASLCVLDFAESLALAYSELAVADNPAADDPPRRPSDQTLEVIKEYRSYPGWLSDREACGLYESLVRSQADEPLVVELGTWQGRSAYVLGSALRSTGGGALHCVDLFDGTGDVVSAPHYAAHLKHRPEENASQVLHALGMRLPDVDVSIHVGRSDEIPTAIEGPVDFIFFDASHDEAAVAKDLEAWLPRVREGTRLAFHDVGSASHAGPRVVLERKILSDVARWRTVLFVDELYVVEALR